MVFLSLQSGLPHLTKTRFTCSFQTYLQSYIFEVNYESDECLRVSVKTSWCV